MKGGENKGEPKICTKFASERDNENENEENFAQVKTSSLRS